MIRRYIVSETPPWKVQEKFPHRVWVTDWALLMLWCFTEQSQGFLVFFFRTRITCRFQLLPHSEFTRLRRFALLTAVTLAQLDILSETLRLMSKPNKSSERLKANILDWTPSALSVNLSLSKPQPNQTQVRGSGHDSGRRYEPWALSTQRVAGPLRCEWCPRALGSSPLLCLPWWFPDASEWSELCGTLEKQPSSAGLGPAGLD